MNQRIYKYGCRDQATQMMKLKCERKDQSGCWWVEFFYVLILKYEFVIEHGFDSSRWNAAIQNKLKGHAFDALYICIFNSHTDTVYRYR